MTRMLALAMFSTMSLSLAGLRAAQHECALGQELPSLIPAVTHGPLVVGDAEEDTDRAFKGWSILIALQGEASPDPFAGNYFRSCGEMRASLAAFARRIAISQ
jgi:hypothetical protein